MLSAEARIDTDRPSRYLGQLCKHAVAMGHGGHGQRMHPGALQQVQVRAEWSDTRGRLTFTPWGECTLIADANTLSLPIDARDQAGLRNIQRIIANNLRRAGHHQDVMVTWQPLYA
jgi:hypothetical protein